MPIAVNTSGATALTPGTPATLATVTAAGGYQLAIDVDSLVATERLDVRILGKCRSGDTARVMKRFTVGPAPGGWVEPLINSLLFYTPHHFQVDVTQINGSSRTPPWAIYDTGADPTVVDSGSQTATITTEHVLSTQTGANAFIFMVDAANLAAGDELELRIYGKARSADTERVMFKSTFGPIPLDEPLLFSPAFLSPHHAKFTLKQTVGTGRAFPWAVYGLG